MEQDFDAILEAANKAMLEVPFGNSKFQNEFFSANQETPARKARHLLLQIDVKNKALKQAEFSLRRLTIEIKKIQKAILNADGFDLELLEIDLEEKTYQLEQQEKLIKDAIQERCDFLAALSKLPPITREQFELEEKDYWTKRLVKEAQLSISAQGTIEKGLAQALDQIGINPIAAQEELRQINYQQSVLALTNFKAEQEQKQVEHLKKLEESKE